MPAANTTRPLATFSASEADQPGLTSAAIVDRMPLTKRPDSSVEYSFTSSTASSITTATGGPSGLEHLGHGEAQHDPVDDRHALEGPAHGGGADPAIGLVPGGDRLRDEGAHEGVGRDGQRVDDLQRALVP